MVTLLSKPKGFLDLPLEIRQEIYGYVFVPRWGTRPVDEMPGYPPWQNWSSNDRKQAVDDSDFQVTVDTEILLVNRQIFREAKEVMYNELLLVKYSIGEEILTQSEGNGAINFPYIISGKYAKHYKNWALQVSLHAPHPYTGIIPMTPDPFAVITPVRYLWEIVQHFMGYTDACSLFGFKALLYVDYNDLYPTSLDPALLQGQFLNPLKQGRCHMSMILGIGSKQAQDETKAALASNITDPESITAYALWQKERGAKFLELSQYEKGCKAFLRGSGAISSMFAVSSARPLKHPVSPEIELELKLMSYKLDCGWIQCCLAKAQTKGIPKTSGPFAMANWHLPRLQEKVQELPDFCLAKPVERARWCYWSAALYRTEVERISHSTGRQLTKRKRKYILQKLEENNKLLIEANKIAPEDELILNEMAAYKAIMEEASHCNIL